MSKKGTMSKKGDCEPDSGSPFSRGLGGSGVLIPTVGLFKQPLTSCKSNYTVPYTTSKFAMIWSMDKLISPGFEFALGSFRSEY